MSASLLRTPLYEWHAAHGARLVPFGGWEMPIQYTSVVEEHQATRRAAALFDISHMGRLLFSGPGSTPFLHQMLTGSLLSLHPGRIRYSLLLNESGGVLDDVLIYRLPDGWEMEHMLVVNASNRDKVLGWLRRHLTEDHPIGLEDRTAAWAMIAVQGPRSAQVLAPLVDVDLNDIRYYQLAVSPRWGEEAMISRTGYTGEDGFEIILPADRSAELWESLLERGAELGVRPAGLGARDTLRLEAGMPLYGHELTEEINPFEAGLEFAVKMNKVDFVGRRALLAARQAGVPRRRVGLALEGKRIARENYPVLDRQNTVGHVTSGTFGPTVQKSIAMAYVPSELADPGQELEVDIRGHRTAARVVELPFYRRKE